MRKFGWVLCSLVLLSISACDKAGVATPNTSPLALTSSEMHYAAVPDRDFIVPKVPVEKIDSEMLRQEVAYPTTRPVGTIIIDPSTKHLYLITQKNRALRYGISVGKAGFGWSGEADITGRTHWPTWTPPPEMIVRRPELAKFKNGQPGGLENPLGARALYLKTNGVDYGYRIHGTPEWASIGHNASSGCIRMINQDVMDLYERVPDGTHVVVLTEVGGFPEKLSVPKPRPKVAKKPKPVEAVAKADPVVLEPVAAEAVPVDATAADPLSVDPAVVPQAPADGN